MHDSGLPLFPCGAAVGASQNAQKMTADGVAGVDAVVSFAAP